MAGDGIVALGATFDKTNVDEGLGSVAEMTKATMDGIASTITEANNKSQTAWKSLSEEVKTAATSVNAEALKVAESSRAVAEAQMDVRRAVTLTKDASLPAAESMAMLAAAQTRLAQESAAAAVAVKEKAAAEAAAAQEAALSSNAIVAGFQRAGMAVNASLSGIQEKLVQTAETGKLSAEGITAGFAGLGSLLGAGIAVGFATHFLDELAKVNVELDHLSVESGIGITHLAGLQQIVKEMGGEWDPIATGIVRLDRAMDKAQQGVGTYKNALSEIGITMEELKGKTPEERLGIVATAFAHTASETRVADAAITLFGEGGLALIPVLKEQGSQLEANMEKEGRLTGVTDQTAEAARRWTQDMAKLSAEFRNVAMPVMEHAGDVISRIAGVFEAAAAVIVSAFVGIATAIVSVFSPLREFGALMKDIFTGNWAGVKADAEVAAHDFTSVWKAGFQQIKESWQEVGRRFSALPPMPKAEFGVDPGDFEPKTKGEKSHGTSKGKSSTAQSQQGSEDSTGASDGLAIWQAQTAVYAQQQLTAGLKAIDKVQSDVAKHGVEVAREAAEEKIRIAHEDFTDFSAQCKFKVQMGQMSERQMIAAVTDAAKKEEQVRQQQSAVIAALDKSDEKRYAEDLKKQEQETREATRKITQLHQQAALLFKQNWDKAMNQFNAGFIKAMNETITHSKTISQAFATMFNQIIMDLVNYVAQWLLKEAEKWAMTKVMQDMGITTQKTVQNAANLATITSDASVAAAGAMAYYSSINPAIASAMAAKQFTATMVYAATLHDTGGMLAHQGMAVNLSGAPERVLSPTQTSNFEKVVNQSTSSSSSSSSSIRLTYSPNINAYDRSGMSKTLKAHADDVLDIVQYGIRSGKLSAA